MALILALLCACPGLEVALGSDGSCREAERGHRTSPNLPEAKARPLHVLQQHAHNEKTGPYCGRVLMIQWCSNVP